MNIAVVALTKNGSILGSKLAKELPAKLFVKAEFVDILKENKMNENDSLQLATIEGQFKVFVKELFLQFDAMIFIMSCGIVVRSISEYLTNKTKDPAVIVLDELGKHAISLLSGHIGGANQLSQKVAQITGGVPVITTATDLNEVLSFDMFAVKNNLTIENISTLKHISGAILNGSKINLYSKYAINGDLPEYINLIAQDIADAENLPKNDELNVAISNYQYDNKNMDKILYLRPKNLILGIGCKKETKMEDIEKAVFDFLEKNNRSFLSIKEVASIDLKKDEKGLIEFCNKYQLRFTTVCSETIKEIEDKFAFSPFVKEQIGVGGVCEPASVLVSTNGKLICHKTCYKGITLAMAEEGCEFSI